MESYLILKAKKDCLLAAKERSTTLWKTEMETISYIKSWGYYNTSRQREFAILIKGQREVEQRPLGTKRSTILQKARVYLISKANRGCLSYIKSPKGVLPAKERFKIFVLNIYIFYKILLNVYIQSFGYDIEDTFI